VQTSDVKRFVMKRNELATIKLFVEFYLPQYQSLLDALKRSPYPLVPLRDLSVRMFDGPFGSNRKVDMYQDSGIPYVRVKDVLPEGINLEGLTYISEEKHQELIRSRVVPGNVLITIAGRVGTAAVFPDALPEGNITGHIAGVEVPNDINPYYLAAFLNSWLGEFQIKRWSHRTTRPELNLRELEQVLISVPPRPIQDCIAQIAQDAYETKLSSLSEAAWVVAQIESFVLGELKIGVESPDEGKRTTANIRKLAGRRFDFEAVVTAKDIDYGDMKLTALRDVVTPLDERITPAEDCPSESINYIGLNNIASNIGEIVDFVPTSGSDVLSASPKFQRGDILFGRMRPYLNKVAIAPFDGVCSGEIAVFRPNPDKVVSSFLHALLLSQLTLQQITPLQRGTSLPRVYPSDILNIKLPIPDDLELQGRIAEEITSRRAKSNELRLNAETIVTGAKSCIEHMILGEEE
jgi:type I restriction enzyme, S subunit